MTNVLPFPLPRATFTFAVTHDAESGMWVAVCDDLCVATEAPTYEALVERVWLIAPEMAMENGLNIPEAHLRLLFQHESLRQAAALVQAKACWVEYNPTYGEDLGCFRPLAF